MTGLVKDIKEIKASLQDNMSCYVLRWRKIERKNNPESSNIKSTSG